MILFLHSFTSKTNMVSIAINIPPQTHLFPSAEQDREKCNATSKGSVSFLFQSCQV